MSLLKNFYPYEYCESVFDIDYQKLFDKGYRGIIFDIDNTLVPHGAPSTPQADALFERVRDIGFQTFLLSDNGKKRIEMFLENIDNCPYIDNAGKPKPDNFLKAVALMGLKKEEVVCIGDQIFKDILGANRSGLANILVKFIGWQTETHPGKRRQVEFMILRRYAHSRYRHRLGDIAADKPAKEKVHG